MNERFIANKLAESPKGWSRKIRRLRSKNDIMAGPTALHEARHLVLLIENGTGAESGTIESGNGYLGMVIPKAWDPIATIGPYAFGDKGGEWDRHQVVLRGHNPDVVGAIARNQLSYLKRKVQLVAGLLERKRTVSGYEAEEAMAEADNPFEVHEYENPEGNVISITARRSERRKIVFDMAA